MIEIISEKKASRVIDTREPIGQFLILDEDGYIGIDNQTGDAWTENFRNLKNCLMFLSGSDLEDCLKLKIINKKEPSAKGPKVNNR